MDMTTGNYDVYQAKPGTIFTSAQISEDGKNVKLFWKFGEGRLDIDLNSPEFDELFPIIHVSKLQLDSVLMNCITNSWNQKNFKRLIEQAINLQIPDFRIARYNPSFQDGTSKIIFQSGEIPAIGESANFWTETFSHMIPEKSSRNMSISEYILYIGYIMNSLIEDGMNPNYVWDMFCVDSSKIENYADSKYPINDLEPTGSRRIGHFFDLGNTSKIVCVDERLSNISSFSDFLLVSGAYNESGKTFPICSIEKLNDPNVKLNYSVGLFVCDV